MAESKANFRRRVARNDASLLQVTTSANGAADGTTLIADELVDYAHGENSLQRALVTRVNTGGDIEIRRISEWTVSTATLTVSRAFSEQVSSGEAIDIYRKFAPAEIDNALRVALTEVYPDIAQLVVDETLVTVADQYEYALPAAIFDLDRSFGGRVLIEIDPDVATFPYEEVLNWSIRQSGETKTLLLPSFVKAGLTIRLIGLAPLTFPATEATTLPAPNTTLDLLSYKVLSLLYRRGIQTAGEDREFLLTFSDRYEQLYQTYVSRWGQTLYPSTIDLSNFSQRRPLITRPTVD